MLPSAVSMKETGKIPRRTARLAACALVLFLTACASPWSGDRLVAGRVDGPPTESQWDQAVPLDVTVWKGNVHEPPELVAIDSETSHRSSADCHHGPSSSDPVQVRLAALASDTQLYLRVTWRDHTRDQDNGRWEKAAGEWEAWPGADDGVAILWGVADSGPMRCQRSCHMMEVDVYDGGTQMRLGMRHDGDGILDLWRWRAGITGPYLLADDMVVDREGKRGDEGQVLAEENRRPGKPGPLVSRGDGAPYYLVTAPRDREAQVKAQGMWDRGRWQVTFRRSLDTGDRDDVVFLPGAAIPFGISVFDNTRTEHHVTETGFNLVFAAPVAMAGTKGEDPYETNDF